MSGHAMAWAIDHPDLPLRDRFTLVTLCDYYGPKGLIYPSLRTLAKRLGMAVNTLRASLDRLVEEGLLAIQKGGYRQGSNRYSLLGYVPPQAETPMYQNDPGDYVSVLPDTEPSSTLDEEETRAPQEEQRAASAGGPEAPPPAEPELVHQILEIVGPSRSAPVLGKQDGPAIVAGWLRSGFTPGKILAAVRTVCGRIGDHERIWSMGYFDHEVRKPPSPPRHKRATKARKRNERPQTPAPVPPPADPALSLTQRAQLAIAQGNWRDRYGPISEMGKEISRLLELAERAKGGTPPVLT